MCRYMDWSESGYCCCWKRVALSPSARTWMMSNAFSDLVLFLSVSDVSLRIMCCGVCCFFLSIGRQHSDERVSNDGTYSQVIAIGIDIQCSAVLLCIYFVGVSMLFDCWCRDVLEIFVIVSLLSPSSLSLPNTQANFQYHVRLSMAQVQNNMVKMVGFTWGRNLDILHSIFFFIFGKRQSNNAQLIRKVFCCLYF